MKIGICTHYTGDWLQLAGITIDVLEKYCDKHNYDLNVNEWLQSGKYTGIDKVLQAIDYLETNDVVMVMDIDTMIMNHTIKIEDLIDDEHDLFITTDYNGINAGVFIIRNTDWGYAFLNYLLDAIKEPNIHCEQDAIKKYVGQYGSNGIKFLPQYKMNSYLYFLYNDIPPQSHEQGSFEVGDFILHLPGVPLATRIDIFSECKKEIIYE